ncbi:MAG TPA: VCBS repeat-containing protein, partial [Candidatus Thermoplasmatota archaeon]|nr:VCBS repeat-containing protein [Candidatus Thermoplasmatota archaeon]
MTHILWIILVISSLSTFSTITSIAAPTNQPLVFGNPSPANGSTGNWWSPPPYGEWIPWNIPISDPEGNRISWIIQCSNGQTTSGTNTFNGSKYLAISPLSYSTTYKIWVNATDPAGSGLWTRKWYTFTTRGDGNNSPVLPRAPSPANGSSGNPLSLSWSIRINDLEGDLFSWSLQCSNGDENSGLSASNGTKSLVLSGLAYSTSYKVWVNATDPDGSGLTIRRWFTFTTKANDPPVFDSPSLTNNSIGNSLGFTWGIPINDPDGNSFNWRIQCSNGQSANANSASNGTKSLSLSGLASSTMYTVWVNATDPAGSGLWTRQWFTFITQGIGGNSPPEFGTPSPANGSSGNRLYFNWNIPVNDPEGTDFSWTIQCNNGQTTSGTSANNGTKSLFLSGLAYSTSYKIWVNATDPTGSTQYTRKWYTFTTETIIPFNIPTPNSWVFVTSASGESRVQPSVADINNDGRMEIIRSGINGIVVYDGKTGTILWDNITTMWDSHNPLEIIDLNNDGYLDVISSYNTGTRALSGEDGSQLWYNANAPLYNKHAVAGDINADGYPEVFVCAAGAEDGTPEGWIKGLTHDGTIFAQVHVYFPCYGGLSLGDTDFDGVYEVYLCERNIGYDGNVVGKGVAAFWASNLTQRWSHPEMLSSSHCPTLVDTNKDGILEVVALAQTGSNGIAVYNSSDGTVIHQSNIPGVRCHSQPTVYDIDGDGNLEIIVGGGSDAWGKPAIWDLYTWSLEAWLPFNCWEPPAIVDLNGDGRVEILECTITNISIFDDNYVFRGSIPLDNNRSGYGWYGMSMIIAQDIDNDNKLELVINRNTRTYAYDTDGAAPTPLASSQYMYYSPLRGRYPYSTPYGATAPWAINEYPANESTNIPFNPQLSVYIYDNQEDSMNIIFRTNASTGVWHNIETYSNIHEGTYTADTTDMDTSLTYYWWSITVTDSTAKTTYKLYKFKTINGEPEPPYTPSNPFPANESTGVPVTADLGWTGGDPNGDPVTYDVYFGTTNPPAKKVYNQSALLYNPSTMSNITHYYWKIIAWDNHSTSTEGPLWEFTTGLKVNNPPNPPSNPSPANGATKVVISAKLSWTGGDPDGDTVTYDVYFGTTSQPPKVNTNQSALTYNPGALAYDTTYYWNIIAWDNHSANVSGTTFDPWNFTTKSPGGGGG